MEWGKSACWPLVPGTPPGAAVAECASSAATWPTLATDFAQGIAPPNLPTCPGPWNNLSPTLTVKRETSIFFFFFFARLFGLGPRARATPAARSAALLGAHRARGLIGARLQPASFPGDEAETRALCCALIHAPDLLILGMEPRHWVVDPLSRRQFWEPDRQHSAAIHPTMTVLVANRPRWTKAASFRFWLVAMDGGRQCFKQSGPPGGKLCSSAHGASHSVEVRLHCPGCPRRGPGSTIPVTAATPLPPGDGQAGDRKAIDV